MRYLKDQDLYEYEHCGEKIKLIKKTRYAGKYSFSRILGRNHIDSTITQLGFSDKVGVPRKFISFGEVVPEKVKICIDIPSLKSPLEKYVVDTSQGFNQFDIYFDQAFDFYAEYIDGIAGSCTGLPAVRAVIVKSGLVDTAPGNFITDGNNKVFFIDTESKKNFFSRNEEEINEGKSICYDLHFKTLAFDIKPEDFNLLS